MVDAAYWRNNTREQVSVPASAGDQLFSEPGRGWVQWRAAARLELSLHLVAHVLMKVICPKVEEAVGKLSDVSEIPTRLQCIDYDFDCDFCSENTAVTLVFPNCSSVFTPKRL